MTIRIAFRSLDGDNDVSSSVVVHVEGQAEEQSFSVETVELNSTNAPLSLFYDTHSMNIFIPRAAFCWSMEQNLIRPVLLPKAPLKAHVA